MTKNVKKAKLLNSAELCRVIGYTENTLRKWVMLKGFPAQEIDGQRMYSIADVFHWRVDYLKKKESENNNNIKNSDDYQFVLLSKEKEMYRKLRIKNDIDEGLLTTVDEERKMGFNIGRVLNDSLIRIATLKSHKLRKCKSDKGTENLLIEYIREAFMDTKERLFDEEDDV
ncbi:MAG: hypothetical protein COA79_23090 [Planctomycetota bacterium]|nr:MAG: hypothetical protein COA79_23090 [Planctomycetota bacterium]